MRKMMSVRRWEMLVDALNGRRPFGAPGVRDPDAECGEFDGAGYAGLGECLSDGHYMCEECSHLSPHAPRFTGSDEGLVDRERLYNRMARRRAEGRKE